VFFLCSEDGHRPIEATSVDLCMFVLRIQEHKAHKTQLDFFSLNDTQSESVPSSQRKHETREANTS
jgi:hypothetical protein